MRKLIRAIKIYFYKRAKRKQLEREKWIFSVTITNNEKAD